MNFLALPNVPDHEAVMRKEQKNRKNSTNGSESRRASQDQEERRGSLAKIEHAVSRRLFRL